ncbi:MAG: UDP-N-acetylglucosamine 2-epimerase (non-hydrolyzing) [Candidatus Anstonellales archaeon]
MIKVACVVGARPQFIKHLPVHKSFLSQSENIKEILIHTGQHYDYLMNKVFFDELGIPEPDYNLEVGSGTHGYQTGEIIKRVEKVLEIEQPDAVIVYGDTNSTIGGALAAVKMHIPVIHVEAGLWSFNKLMPEEINRVLTDHSSAVLLCPTKNAVENLKKEGFTQIVNDGNLLKLNEEISYTVNSSKPLVVNVGDVMYDVLLYSLSISSQKSKIVKELGLEHKGYNLLKLHRAENTKSSLKLMELIDFVETVTGKTPVIFPVHPRTKKIFHSNSINIPQIIRMIEPLGYLDMLELTRNCNLVFTDSGGLQKEAYWLKVPCITLRDETEWIETVQSGWNVLYKDYKVPHNPYTYSNDLYGDGRASERIVNILIQVIKEN